MTTPTDDGGRAWLALILALRAAIRLSRKCGVDQASASRIFEWLWSRPECE